ncbi:hypothetical protein [Sedimenticola selenatireducens]|uniref:hypothetical protein n=1 Tax=Sedimenticola selenatireducens TaxID=191960 RepID=UPI003F4AD2A1
MRTTQIAVVATLLLGFSGVVIADKTLAHSKSLGMSFTALGDVWCAPEVKIRGDATDAGKFATPDYGDIIQRLGQVLSRECPDAERLSITGMSDGRLVWNGEAEKGDGWRIRQPATASVATKTPGSEKTGLTAPKVAAKTPSAAAPDVSVDTPLPGQPVVVAPAVPVPERQAVNLAPSAPAPAEVVAQADQKKDQMELAGGKSGAPASAAIRIPDCEAIVIWASRAYQEDQDTLRSGGRPFQSGTWLLSGFKDEYWIPVFGAPFPEITPAEYAKFAQTVEACRRELRPEMLGLPRGHPRRDLLIGADDYVLRAALGQKLNPQTAAPVLARHKAAYKAYDEAIATRDAQLSALKSLPPEKESFETLNAMKKDKKLIALGPARTPHVQLLDAATLDLADRMVMAAAEEIKKFPESLDGLRGLITYRATARAELSRYKSRKVQDFLTIEAERTNALAAAALPGFVAEMQAAPASAEGKATVQAAVNTLFPQQPLPRNIRAYRKAVTKRLAEIDEEMNSVACKNTLARYDLSGDAATPLLGPGGESTFGAFVCALTDKGLAFGEYKKPGFFGSTHELVMQIPSGPSLVFEMELVEAIKGKPDMLVGTRMKDPTQTRDLTVTAWQELAAELTGYTPPGIAGEALLPAAQAQLDSTPQGCVTTVYTQSVTAFPVTLQAGAMDRDTVRRFALLGDLGLIEVEERPSQNVSYRNYRYTLTAMAEPYFQGKHGLCFAKLAAEEISDISAPFKRDGRTYVTGILEASPVLPEFALDPRFAQAVDGPVRGLINSMKTGQAIRSKVAFVRTDAGWEASN